MKHFAKRVILVFRSGGASSPASMCCTPLTTGITAISAAYPGKADRAAPAAPSSAWPIEP